MGKFAADFLARKLGPSGAFRRATSQADNLARNGFFTSLNSAQTVVSVTGAAAGTGGTLAAGDYSYKATTLTYWGETLPSAERIATGVAANGSVTLALSNPASGRGKNIYRKAPGASTWKLIGTVSAVTTSFVDNGSVAGGVDAPTVDTSQLVTDLNNGTATLHKLDGVPLARAVEGIRGNVLHLTPYVSGTTDVNDYIQMDGWAAGDVIEVSMLARSSGAGETKHIVRVRNAVPASIGNYILSGTRINSDWRLLTGRFTVPAAAATIRISFEGSYTLDWLEVAEVFARKVS